MIKKIKKSAIFGDGCEESEQLSAFPSAVLGNLAASLMMLTANLSVRASSDLANSLFSIFQL